eukprot:scaffold8.g1533.t1
MAGLRPVMGQRGTVAGGRRCVSAAGARPATTQQPDQQAASTSTVAPVNAASIAGATGSVAPLDAASTAGRAPDWAGATWRAAAGASALALACLLLPGGASAAEAAAPGLLELVMRVVDELGPWGPAAFVLAVSACQCMPVFPTQPFSLASGLLFGAGKGAALVWSGTMLAAVASFLLARTVGQGFAQRTIHETLGGAGEGEGSKGGGLAMAGLRRALAGVDDAILHGSFARQAAAIFLMRMTPVVPYSASSYIVGMGTHLPLAPYVVGSAFAMAIWSALYASVGGASRHLLLQGVSPDMLMAGMVARASEYTGEVALAGGLVLAGALALRLARQHGWLQPPPAREAAPDAHATRRGRPALPLDLGTPVETEA